MIPVPMSVSAAAVGAMGLWLAAPLILAWLCRPKLRVAVLIAVAVAMGAIVAHPQIYIQCYPWMVECWW